MSTKPNPQKKQPPKNNAGKSTSDRVMSSAQRIVNSAVNVLEEEIAAGILAAKKLESKFINVEEVRSNQDELMNRIRRDTHEAVDLFLDAFATLAHHMNGIVEKAKSGNRENREAKSKKTTEKFTQPIVLESDRILKAGESHAFQIMLSDDENEAKVSLLKTDFIGNNNTKISQRNITIKPASISLNPKEKAEINILVKIPKNAAPGFYRAILSDKLDPKIIIILSIQISE